MCQPLSRSSHLRDGGDFYLQPDFGGGCVRVGKERNVVFRKEI